MKPKGWGLAAAASGAGGEVGTEARKRAGRAGADGVEASRRAARSTDQGPVKTGFMGSAKALKAGTPRAEGVSNMQLSGQVRRTGCMLENNVFW